jgi:hypothetical protein
LLRRLFWVALGLGMGLGLSFWLARFVRETAARYAPERLGADLAGAVRELGRDVAAAIREGREDMRARESELRARLGPPPR